MIYKYRVTYYLNTVEKKEILRETEHMVTYETTGYYGKTGVVKERKKTTDIEWFDTREEAYSFAINKTKEKIEKLRLNISRQKEVLNELRKNRLKKEEEE